MIPFLLSSLGLLLLLIGLLLRLSFGMKGEIVYMDDEQDSLFSRRYQLAGKPDFIEKADGVLIPVEFKSTRVPKAPYNSHVLQLFAYCLLVEDVYRTVVSEGRLLYKGGNFVIPFTDADRIAVKRAISRIQMTPKGKAKRNHASPERCASCSFAKDCSESLV